MTSESGLEEYGPTMEHGDIPETQSMRERRECMDWIVKHTKPQIHHILAREIMDHCFSVARKLLGKGD